MANVGELMCVVTIVLWEWIGISLTNYGINPGNACRTDPLIINSISNGQPLALRLIDPADVID